jgi:hypothetical protein
MTSVVRGDGEEKKAKKKEKKKKKEEGGEEIGWSSIVEPTLCTIRKGWGIRGHP